MKAVVITSPGGVEVLEIREIETPSLTETNNVLVRVHASALNRADILQRRGLYPAPPDAPRDIPGLEFAGEVEQLGDSVRTWKTGQRVFGITGGGAHAQYVAVRADHLAEIPSNLDWLDAAAVPEAFITAHDALFSRVRLQSGESVMVHAAGSGVGTAAIQLARSAGARVFGTSRTADKLERAKQYGLGESLVVADSPESIVEAVQAWTKGRGVDVIIDLVGAAYLEANVKSLASLGRIVLVGTTAGARGMLDLSTVMGSARRSWELCCAPDRRKKKPRLHGYSLRTFCRCSPMDLCDRLSIEFTSSKRFGRRTGAWSQTKALARSCWRLADRIA